jgi:hypothetical protein
MPTKPRTADERRRVRQEEYREKLSVSQSLVHIEKADEFVRSVVRGEDITEQTPVRLQAAKLTIDTQFRKLAKVLPDLKAVELSSDPDSPVVIRDERSLDAYFERLALTITDAESRVASVGGGQGEVH